MVCYWRLWRDGDRSPNIRPGGVEEKGGMRTRIFPWLCGALAIAAALPGPAAASAASTQTCKGTVEKPGVLVGRYSGDVRVAGACAVSARPAEVRDTLTLRPVRCLRGRSG